MRRFVLILLSVVAAVSVCLTAVGCGEKDGFTYEKTEGGVVITGYNGEEKNIVIPETIGGKKVVAIGEGAFDGKLIESAELPESVTEIGKYAFRRCGYLTSVKINGDVKVIPEGAFNYCMALTEAVLPDTVESIEENAFGKSGLTEITLPDSVKRIGDYVFYECHGLKSFNGGKGLEEIGNNTFGNCVHLTEVKLNGGVKKIGEYAFSGAVMIKDIDLPETVETLSMGVLSGASFEEYTVPAGVGVIETYAFAGCKKMEKIYIPDTVKEIKNDAFKDCKNLVICGVRDSEAEIFADTYGFKFEEYSFG